MLAGFVTEKNPQLHDMANERPAAKPSQIVEYAVDVDECDRLVSDVLLVGTSYKHRQYLTEIRRLGEMY